jgi:hypothetical protein
LEFINNDQIDVSVNESTVPFAAQCWPYHKR